MRKFLWILAIAGFVVGGLMLLSDVLAGNGAPQPAGSAQAECDCSHLKVLQIELRNAIRLQQAFRNKIAELRTMNGDTAQGALKAFAQGEARRGLEPIPSYKGPSEFDYSPWGENQRTFNFPTEQLCRMSDSATVEFDKAVAASACAGIGKALRAHEEVHGNMCRSLGYQGYLAMHGADRAQEEVEAYGAQIKVLRDIINRLRCGYRATGRTADVVYSGVICSLEQPFTVTGTSPLNSYPFKFVPTSATTGTASFGATAPGISMEGSGSYKIEGADTDKPRIAMTLGSVGHTPVGSRSGGGTVYIDLVPLETGECQASQPR
jgi:hypothetical protein